MKTRSKRIDNWWYPQRRFLLFWFIPTFWTNMVYEYGDDFLLGLGPTEHKFPNKKECDNFLRTL